MKINGIDFTVGADPEIFVKKNGEFVCAHGLVPGDKQNPHTVDKGAIQVDGMALEFNIDPASSEDEFNINLDAVMSELQSMIPGMEFMDESSVIFSEKFLESVPQEALAIGCSPDFDAYSMDVNEKPDQSLLMRTTGGHIHVGGFFTDSIYEESHFNSSAKLARILDETIGLPSLIWDKDDTRREMYGKGGCFRPKKYGMEYRTLSNNWIFNNLARKIVFNGVSKALELMFEGYEPDRDIQKVINNSDRKSSIFLENNHVLSAKNILGV